MAGILTGVITFIIGFFVTVWNGYVATVMWGWFIVEPFGYRQITIYEAAGVIYVLSILMPKNGVFADGDALGENMFDLIGKTLFFGFLFPFLTLIGAAVWRFVHYMGIF